jgi:hypothetical protein
MKNCRISIWRKLVEGLSLNLYVFYILTLNIQISYILSKVRGVQSEQLVRRQADRNRALESRLSTTETILSEQCKIVDEVFDHYSFITE